MVAIVLSAIVTCAAVPIIGQAILRVCGFDRWSWQAAPIGLSAAILVAVLAPRLPGRTATTAVLLAGLAIAGAVWLLRDRAQRPAIADVLAVLPVAALTMVPFAAAGRGGILGVGFNNDMANHLIWAESLRSAEVAAVTPVPTDYPMGAHALAATIAQGLGVDVALAFSGLTVASAILLAWTALGMLDRDAGLLARLLVATVAGLPFLVAGYLGQGAFKEVMQALFVLGTAVALFDRAPRAGLLRWAPVALIAAGTLSVYSFLGLPWIVGLLGMAAGIAALARLRAASPRALAGDLRAAAVPALAAVVVLVIAVAPQIPDIADFVERSAGVNGTPIAADDFGNLVGPLPLWESFGVWDNADYRLPPIDATTTHVWTAFVAALVLLGLLWSVRRREWILPAAAFVSLMAWIASDRTQSPYVAAKALLILSPLLLLLAARPLVDRAPDIPRAWRYVAPVLALVLAFKVAESSLQALRFSPVGNDDQTAEVRSLRPLLDGRPTLFLGNDDFVLWQFAGVRVEAPVIGFQRLLFKKPKTWAYGQAFDIDSIEAKAINEHDWVIAPRDAASSEMPPELALVRRTRSFALWRRTGAVQERAVLPEGDAAAAKLDCETPAGRRIVRGGGEARVRPPTTALALPPFTVGTSIGGDLPLAPGTYDLVMAYLSPQPIDLEVVGHLKRVMPPYLGRPGPRWPIGRITVAPGAKRLVRVGMYARRTRITSPRTAAVPGSVVAVPVGGARVVPIREACGKLVDWYRPARPR